jgi:hypothetical protein
MHPTDRQHYVRAIRPDLHSSVPCVYRFCDQYGTAHTDPCTEDLFLIYGMTRDAYDQIQHLGIK